METGIVKFFNQTKGFGFIKTKEQDIFVHVTGLIDQNIQQGDHVSFEITQEKKDQAQLT